VAGRVCPAAAARGLGVVRDERAGRGQPDAPDPEAAVRTRTITISASVRASSQSVLRVRPSPVISCLREQCEIVF